MHMLLLAQAQPQGGSAFISFLPIILLFFLFWVMIIVPQRKQAKQHAAMVASLAKGDRVVTMGGLIGEVLSVREDELQLRSGTSTLVVERARIARRIDAPAPQG